MPVIVKIKCPNCKGGTDQTAEVCVPCEFQATVERIDGAKHIPSYYISSGERRGNERNNNNALN